MGQGQRVGSCSSHTSTRSSSGFSSTRATCQGVGCQLHFAGALDALTDRQPFADHLQPARQTEWVVYAKPPFAGPDQVLDYVGRYTHRIAIANQRLLDLDDGQVRFRYTDYRRPRSPHRRP